LTAGHRCPPAPRDPGRSRRPASRGRKGPPPAPPPLLSSPTDPNVGRRLLGRHRRDRPTPRCSGQDAPDPRGNRFSGTRPVSGSSTAPGRRALWRSIAATSITDLLSRRQRPDRPSRQDRALIWNGLSRRRFCLVDGMVCGQQASRAGARDRLGGWWSGVLWWWRSGSLRDPTTRRDGVDRLAATLIFAGWDRTSAMRRKVPLTRFATARPWHRALGDRSCSGGVPARRGHVHLLGRSRVGEPVTGSGGHLGP
jgi:hypothetical protein